ncbi:hypothetical protein ACX0HA_02780 [Flavobacterium hauense]
MTLNIKPVNIGDNNSSSDNLSVGGNIINDNFEQLADMANNVGRRVFLGYVEADTVINTILFITKMNARVTEISEKETPVLLYINKYVLSPEDAGLNTSSQTTMVHSCLLMSGAGKYGASHTPVDTSMLWMLPARNLLPTDLTENPDITIEPLVVPESKTFVDVANESLRYWEDNGNETDSSSIKQYYFTFEKGGTLLFAFFKGTAGTYGNDATPFTEEMFSITTQSDTAPEKTKLSEFINDVPFVEADFNKTITCGANGDYETLETLFADEPAGKTLILLTDAVTYNVENPKFVIKEGWILRGQGIGKTRIAQTFNTTIDPDTSGFHIRQTCKLEDFELITINNVTPGGLGQYALHADYSTYSFDAEINRCSFRTVLSADSADFNDFNGLVVGIGTWEDQNLTFNHCFFEGAYVTYSDKYTLNLHNKYTASPHLLPSRVLYNNCLQIGGYTTVLISDVYSNDAEPNEDRVQDLYEFTNGYISSLWLRSHSQLGTIPKKNGILYNFTGTKVFEFLNTAEVVDTSLSNYTVKSLPVTEDVEFLKNIGATTINAGDFVCYIYDDRLPEYHLTSEKTINTVIGIEKLTSVNIKNFAGIALATSAAGNFNHFAKGAIAYTALTSTNLNIGDVVTFDSTGNLIKAWFGGIGVVRKKSYDNRLGIELTPTGAKSNVIGDDTHRGIIEVEGKAGTVGPPTIRMTDHNSDSYGWQITNGVNPNSGPGPDLGRFAISDLAVGVERFGISKDGAAKVSGRSFYVQNLDYDSDPYTMIYVGSLSKPGYFKMVNAFNAGNGFEIFQNPVSGVTSINPNSTTLAVTIQADGRLTSEKAPLNPKDVVRLGDVQTVIRHTETIDFPDPGDHATSFVSFPVTGAAVGDEVSIIPPIGIISPGPLENLVFTAYVSATDEVTAKCHNMYVAAMSVSNATFKFIIRK